MKNIILSFVFLFGLLVSVSGLYKVIASAPNSSVSTAPASTEVLAQKSSGSATIVREKQGLQLKFEQTTDGTEVPGGFLLRNWDSLLFGLLAFYELVSRLTPTEKDNTIVRVLTSILNAVVPNFKKGGGIF